MGTTAMEDEVKCALEDKVVKFVEAVSPEAELRLDGYIDDGCRREKNFPPALASAPEGFKIDNCILKKSVIVPISVIVENPLDAIMSALLSFEFTKLYGVTRIVGYYSRVTNWNKSKVGELKNRHEGNYSV